MPSRSTSEFGVAKPYACDPTMPDSSTAPGGEVTRARGAATFSSTVMTHPPSSGARCAPADPTGRRFSQSLLSSLERRNHILDRLILFEEIASRSLGRPRPLHQLRMVHTKPQP